MEQSKRVVIEKSTMINLPPFQKQAFLMSFSLLEHSDLFSVSIVCKCFFFMLKEDEKFWKSFVTNKCGVNTLPKEHASWKKLFMSMIELCWDDSSFETTKFETDETKKIATYKGPSIWMAAKSSQHLLEGLMYGVEVVNTRR